MLTRRLLSALLSTLVPTLAIGVALPGGLAQEPEGLPPPLPRWREGGTPYDAGQSLHPFALQLAAPESAPGGALAAPPEYEPTHGVIYMFIQGQWHSVVVDLVAAQTSDPLHDEIAYVVVTSAAQEAFATSLFVAAGADMSKVVFLQQPANSVWIRDYGPHFVWQDGTQAIVDSHYYPNRPLDNFAPTLLAEQAAFDVPSHHMGLYYSGGNFQPGPNRSAFVTSLILLDNTAAEGFSVPFIEELYSAYQGIDTLHIMPQLPFSVDGTGHIDMWMYLVDEDTVIISQFLSGSNATAINITNNAVPYMEALGFEVFRTPAWNGGSTHYTYTNAYRVNDRIFVPTYASGNANFLSLDTLALQVWQDAAGPEVEIIPIDCYSIIPAAGAIHCIIMQVPRYVDPLPAVRVAAPRGGELLPAGSTRTIEWEATDTSNAPLSQVDLYYTLNNGANYTHIATTADTGSYDWTVPAAATGQARVKVVATAADLDQATAVSPQRFEISPVKRSVYDFSVGGGLDRFGFGYETSSWTAVDGNRAPVSSEVSALVPGAYLSLAHSDATGGDADPNRYISPPVASGFESTHTFEFTLSEDPAQIDALNLLWEGYADQCTQAELYVWDYQSQQWGDGAGLLGQNRYLANCAENRDGVLRGSLRADLERYVGPGGQLTLLVYAERNRDETFHDFVQVEVLRKKPLLPGRFGGPSARSSGP